MSWKLIQLKPLNPFFFGRESVFTNTNYPSSEYFPQQTQITGALRLYWMEQNKLMRIHKDGKYVPYEKKDAARNLVGNAGALDFDINDNIGAILTVSPMFIVETENECTKDAFFEIPHDIVYAKCQNQTAKPKRLRSISSNKPVVLLDTYDVKEGFVDGFGGVDFWRAYLAEDQLGTVCKHGDVYIECQQVGIALGEDKQTQEGKFYRKHSYTLAENYTFGVLIEIDDEKINDKELSLEDGIITIGADSSMFSLSVKDIPKILESHPIIQSMQEKEIQSGTKIVLLSDSILTHSIQKDSFFQIVREKVPFKMMQGKVLDENSLGAVHLESKERKASYSKTKEKLLVPKGSVYYFEKPNTLEEAKGAYRKMGFNQYLVIN